MAVDGSLATMEISYRAGTRWVRGSMASMEVFVGLEGGDPLRGRRQPQMAFLGHDYDPEALLPVGFGGSPPPLTEP